MRPGMAAANSLGISTVALLLMWESHYGKKDGGCGTAVGRCEKKWRLTLLALHKCS